MLKEESGVVGFASWCRMQVRQTATSSGGAEMYNWTRTLKDAWWYMLEPPWRHSGRDWSFHWFAWLTGWAWALAGLVLGAVVAPSLLQFAGLSDTPYQDALVIGVAVVTGFLVQFLAWCLLAIAEAGGAAALPDTLPEPRFGIVAWLATIVIVVLPLSGVGYGLYRYFTWVGADQGTVTVAFVGGLLVKTFVIPLIKGIVTGAAFKVLMNWLRGGKKKGT